MRLIGGITIFLAGGFMVVVCGGLANGWFGDPPLMFDQLVGESLAATSIAGLVLMGSGAWIGSTKPIED